jgi:hypothetical protein
VRLIGLILALTLPGFATLPTAIIVGQSPVKQSDAPATDATGPAETTSDDAENDGAGNSKSNQLIVARALTLVPGNQPVIEELGLLDDQLEQVREIQNEYGRMTGEAARKMQKVDGLERRQMVQKIVDDIDTKPGEAMLPRQVARLKQLAIQSLAISREDGSTSVANLVANATVRQQLGFSNETVEKVRAALKEENARLETEIERLKQESQQRVLQVLSEDEQRRLKERIGETFDFQGYVPGRGGRFRNIKNDH